MAQESQGNSCITCHSDMWEEMKGSIHSQNGITCNKCHGGDPTQADMDRAKAPETGYRGIPDKKDIPLICGECHADVEVMNFYGIRTDQLARYKTSVHGKKLLLEGDNRVAACSDCHGYHDVLPVSDPGSPVYPSNLPKTCNQCHGNAKLMGSYGLPSDIYETYRNSVHGKALFEKKDISVAQCASCHGGHGAVPPGVKDVGATCGKCHLNEKKYFLESVHAPLTEKGNFHECISCHGNHGVQHPTPDLYQTACGTCHDPQSPEAQQGQELARMIRGAQQSLAGAQALVKQASVEGIFVEQEEASLDEAKTKSIEMGPAQHTLSLSKIADLHDKIVATVGEVEAKILEKRENLRWRKVSLIFVWIFVLGMVVALRAKYKQLNADRKDYE